MMDNAKAAAALVAAQKEMGKAHKGKANPHFKSKYAPLGEVMDACYPALHGNGFAILQPQGKDEFGSYVETVFLHESGERLSSRVYLIVDKPTMQGMGSAITYARRYGLIALAGIADTDDDGNAAAAPPQRPPAPREPEPDAFEGAVNQVKAEMQRATTLDGLAKVWKSWVHAPDVLAREDVKRFKDARKAELSQEAEE